jgi:hypothetical protein
LNAFFDVSHSNMRKRLVATKNNLSLIRLAVNSPRAHLIQLVTTELIEKSMVAVQDVATVLAGASVQRKVT